MLLFSTTHRQSFFYSEVTRVASIFSSAFYSQCCLFTENKTYRDFSNSCDLLTRDNFSFLSEASTEEHQPTWLCRLVSYSCTHDGCEKSLAQPVETENLFFVSREIDLRVHRSPSLVASYHEFQFKGCENNECHKPG